jgi:hypothetical protein
MRTYCCFRGYERIIRACTEIHGVMRRHADWITQADERILECLEDSDFPLPKEEVRERLAEAGVGDAMVYAQSYVDARIARLQAFGFVEATQTRQYALSEKGTLYLRGEFDASLARSGDAGERPVHPNVDVVE